MTENAFQPIETQEAFDKAISERLKRQKETLEEKYKDYDQLKSGMKKLQDELQNAKDALSGKSEAEKSLKEEVEDLKGQISGFELSKIKVTKALEYGIPYTLAGRLQGESEEEIEADAKAFSKVIDQTTHHAPLKETGAQTMDAETQAYAQMANNLFKGE